MSLECAGCHSEEPEGRRRISPLTLCRCRCCPVAGSRLPVPCRSAAGSWLTARSMVAAGDGRPAHRRQAICSKPYRNGPFGALLARFSVRIAVFEAPEGFGCQNGRKIAPKAPGNFQFFTPTFQKFSTFFAFFRFFDPPVRCFSVCEDGNGKTKGNRQRATDSDSGCALLAATRSGARERTRNVAWAFSLAPALPRFYRAGQRSRSGQ